MPSNQEIAAQIVERHRYTGEDGCEPLPGFDSVGLTSEIAKALTDAKTPEGQRNRYDKFDRVKQEAMLRAFPIKVAAYRVRDPETDEWSPIQFHMTYDNCVMGVMSEQGAKLFATFVRQTMGDEPQPASDISGWLSERMEQSDRDADAHPEGSGNRSFYRGQAVAYENALSAIRRSGQS